MAAVMHTFSLSFNFQPYINVTEAKKNNLSASRLQNIFMRMCIYIIAETHTMQIQTTKKGPHRNEYIVLPVCYQKRKRIRHSLACHLHEDLLPSSNLQIIQRKISIPLMGTISAEAAAVAA